MKLELLSPIEWVMEWMVVRCRQIAGFEGGGSGEVMAWAWW